jgi:NitT/TauT family transport system substrate-binding protein
MGLNITYWKQKTVTLLAASLFMSTVTWAEDIRLAQNASPISGVTMVAKANGYFADQGLNVEVLGFTSGRAALEAVIGGGAHIATTAEAPTTAAAMSGTPIAFLARTQYSDLKTLTAASSNINNLEDLRGKKIGYTAGTGGEVYSVKLLEAAGLTRNDVTLINLRPQEMAAAMSSGSIDAFNTWEPHVANTQKALGDEVALIDTSGIYAETFNIVTMVDYLEKQPDVLKRFMTALITAEEFIKENPDLAIPIIAEAASMPKEDLEATWDDYVYEVALDQRTIDVLTSHAEWRIASGNHAGPAELPIMASFIFPSILQSVAPDRVKVSSE